MAGRRMSRLVKMGVCAAKKCIAASGVSMPDAIITGTGLGCIEDTEKFMGSVITNNELQLNPTPFIQSTHNTPAASVALAIKCHNYNSTYVHRAFSFENALMDAAMFLADNPGSNVLAGGFDENTPVSLAILRRFGLLKYQPVDSFSLLDYGTAGTLAGEGVAYFMLSPSPENCSSAVTAVETRFNPYDISKILQNFAGCNLRNGCNNIILAGFNGDRKTDIAIQMALTGLTGFSGICFYKHLCGEYDTSMAFALWLADYILTSQTVPAEVQMSLFDLGGIDNIFIYNNYLNRYHSMIMVSKI